MNLCMWLNLFMYTTSNYTISLVIVISSDFVSGISFFSKIFVICYMGLSDN